jgi:predicted kinase
MSKLYVLCGPPGSGKSTFALKKCGEEQGNLVYINQDSQGKNHLNLFKEALELKDDIVIDRMGFSKEQRERYLKPAKEAGYETEIVIFHVPRTTCFERIMSRENHGTINGKKLIDGGHEIIDTDEKSRQANSALDTFFCKYERVEDSEADKVTRLGWVTDTHKTKPAVICDLDGTLCNLDHRLHYVKNENKKLNRWDLFEKEVGKDGIYEWCKILVTQMQNNYPIIFCSGRNENARKDTEEWLKRHDFLPGYSWRHLFMRHRQDYRQDYIIKEIILEFEIKTRYSVLFSIDDRKQVVDMWRKHGIVCLQCAPGDF